MRSRIVVRLSAALRDHAEWHKRKCVLCKGARKIIDSASNKEKRNAD